MGSVPAAMVGLRRLGAAMAFSSALVVGNSVRLRRPGGGRPWGLPWCSGQPERPVLPIAPW
jgi:hypothetical protein